MIKLNQQIKRHGLSERKQLGEFCEQFAFDIPKQKSKDLESEGEQVVQNAVYTLVLNIIEHNPWNGKFNEKIHH